MDNTNDWSSSSWEKLVFRPAGVACHISGKDFRLARGNKARIISKQN
jgi:hypothetical protein